MPANKNALIRYKTIDKCLRNRYRRWTLEDLVNACSDAIYDAEGISKGVSVRTVQGDIQMMRSDKIGYDAPIEVYDHKYYRYSDDNYSIMNMPMSENEIEVMREAVDMLRHLEDFNQFSGMNDIINRLENNLAISSERRKPIIHFDSVPDLRGINFLSRLYKYISEKKVLRIIYKSFNSPHGIEFILHPYLLKEFRNRWFLYGSRDPDMVLFNLPLDRIESVDPVEIPYKENSDFDSMTFFNDVIGVSKNIGSTARRILFKANKEQSKYILTKPLHPTQRLIEENEGDGSYLFEIKVVINHEMYSVFMSYGPGVEILSPRHVRSYMRDKLREAADVYS